MIFPLKDPQMLPLWIKAINRDNFVPTKSSKLCSDHFIHSDYLVRPNTYIQHLKPDAVPSIFDYHTGKTKVSTKSEIINAKPHKSNDFGEMEFVVCNKELSDSELCLTDNEMQTDDVEVEERNEADLQSLIKIRTGKEMEMKTDTKKAELKILTVYCNDKEVQTAEPSMSYTDANVRFLRLRMKTLHQQLRRKDQKLKQLKYLLQTMEEKGVIERENVMENENIEAKKLDVNNDKKESENILCSLQN